MIQKYSAHPVVRVIISITPINSARVSPYLSILSGTRTAITQFWGKTATATTLNKLICKRYSTHQKTISGLSLAPCQTALIFLTIVTIVTIYPNESDN